MELDLLICVYVWRSLFRTLNLNSSSIHISNTGIFSGYGWNLHYLVIFVIFHSQCYWGQLNEFYLYAAKAFPRALVISRFKESSSTIFNPSFQGPSLWLRHALISISKHFLISAIGKQNYSLILSSICIIPWYLIIFLFLNLSFWVLRHIYL